MKRTIGNLSIGGDVVNSFIQSGYDQELSAVANSPLTSLNGQTIPAGGVFNGEAPPTIVNRISNSFLNQPTFAPLAHGGGGIHGRIAGNVTNSIISVSVDPNPSGINNPGQYQLVTSTNFPFGAPSNIVLPRGVDQRQGRGQGRQQRPPVGNQSAGLARHRLEHRLLRQEREPPQGPVVPPDVASGPVRRAGPLSQGQLTLRGSSRSTTR